MGAVAGLGLLAMTGCMSTPDRSAGRVIDDRMISSKVKNALDDSSVYKFDDVRVNTYKGVVQLSGFVDTEEQKQRATELVRNVPAVREIVNNISLKPRDEYSTAKGRAAGEREVTTGAGTDRTAPPPRPADTTPNP
jgi:hyperosmotically inducible periplasmic protein